MDLDKIMAREPEKYKKINGYLKQSININIIQKDTYK
jgi:hypothetical protein